MFYVCCNASISPPEKNKAVSSLNLSHLILSYILVNLSVNSNT